MFTITKSKVKWPQRGISLYPVHGLVQTKFMVMLDDDKIWRRVYDRYDGIVGKDRKFVLVVKVLGEPIDLTPEQSKIIGYNGRNARQ